MCARSSVVDGRQRPCFSPSPSCWTTRGCQPNAGSIDGLVRPLVANRGGLPASFEATGTTCVGHGCLRRALKLSTERSSCGAHHSRPHVCTPDIAEGGPTVPLPANGDGGRDDYGDASPLRRVAGDPSVNTAPAASREPGDSDSPSRPRFGTQKALRRASAVLWKLFTACLVL